MKGDVRQDPTLFGRSTELYLLVRNLQSGRHTLLVGPKGIGKTRLMVEASAILTGKVKRIEFTSAIMSRITGQLGIRVRPDQYKVLYIMRSSPLGDCLKEMAELLFLNQDLPPDLTGDPPAHWPAVKRRFVAAGSVRQQDIICSSLTAASRPYLIFFDSLDRIAPIHQVFLEKLLTIAVICAAIVQVKPAFHFRKIWASFSRIDLEPLPEKECAELIDYYLRNYPVGVIDRALYRREILKSAHGNPFLIKSLIWHGSREKHLGTEEIRKLRRLEEGDLFNMGPIYIFAASILTLSKIFSLGTGNREFYIYFSALGFLVYLTFRVFRTFFLFRPQKYTR